MTNYFKFRTSRKKARNIIKKDARMNLIDILGRIAETPEEQHKRIQEERKEEKAGQQRLRKEQEVINKYREFRSRKDSIRRK